MSEPAQMTAAPGLEALGSTLLTGLPCFVAVQDRSLRLVEVNDIFAQSFSAEAGEHCWKACRQRAAPCAACPVEATFLTGLPQSQRETLRTVDGELLEVMVNTAPLAHGGRQPQLVLSVATRLDGPLLQLAERRLASLLQVIGSVSQRAVGLLTAVDGGAYLVSSGLSRQDKSRVDKGRTIIQRNTGRLRSLVLDVLLFADGRPLEYEQIHAVELAAEIWNLISGRAEELGVELERQLEVSAGRLTADPNGLRTALINVLEYAIDACHDNRKKQRPRLLLRVYRDDIAVVFSVSLSCRLDPETLQHSLDDYYTARDHDSGGVGLFISSKIIHQHRGRIEVKRAGGGTEMAVRIPSRRIA